MQTTTFHALLLSLPAHNSTLRMRLWRALKGTGCATLRDGVYVLPADAPQVKDLADVESEVKAAGGFAMTVGLTLDKAQQDDVRRAFARDADYGALVAEIRRARDKLKALGKRKADTAVQRLRRAFEDVVAIDFYPGEAQQQAKAALSALEVETHDLFAEGEPRRSRARVKRLDGSKYRGRTWATRKAPWVDRLASAWLIKRFIDRDAKFVWIESPRDSPKRAIGFDFDGATFTHAGPRVTYEVLLATFGLEHDAALTSIGAAVHFLDVGGIAVPDAKGLETLLTGLREKTRNDDEMAREAGKIFDLLYRAYGKQGQDEAA
jgi:hypothetical protein